jgi:hypothetical protein
MESHAQVDNTLLMSINALLIEGLTDPVADIANLMTFAHAVILFDKVEVPIWSPDKPGTKYFSPDIVSREIFQDALDLDYRQRWDDLFKFSFLMTKPSTGRIEQNNQSVRNIRLFVQKILLAQGHPWPNAFRRHIQRLVKTQEEMITKEIITVMNTYALDVKYIKLPIEEKAALTYLWRSLYNVSFSIENQRPYLHNIFRLPFVNAIYRDIEKRNISVSGIDNETRILKSLDYQSVVHRTILPSLLGCVLNGIEKKEQIIPKILEIRDNKYAKNFRSHYAELQEKIGEPSAALHIEKEIGHLVRLWAGIADPIAIPISWAFPNYSGPDIKFEVPTSVNAWAQRYFIRLKKRHLRLIIDLLEHPQYFDQLSKSTKKIFSSKITYR